MKNQIKTFLRKNSFTRPVIRYLQDFLDEYRLPDQMEAGSFPEYAPLWPAEGASLVIVCPPGVDGAAWLGRLVHRHPENIEKVSWLGSAFDLKTLAPDLAEKIHFQEVSGQVTGREINTAIQAASSALVVLVHAALQPVDDWLDGLLSPFALKDQPCDFSIGQVKPFSNWRGLALYGPAWDYLPFLGVAFRKQAWARAGGLPESLSLPAAWALFALRLKSLPGRFFQVPRVVAQIDEPGDPFQVFRRARQYGQVGLFASNVHSLAIAMGLALSAAGLAIFLPFVLSPLWLFFAGLIFLVSILMAALTTPRQARADPEAIKFSALLLTGFLRQVYFVGYAVGVLDRQPTRQNLEKEYQEKLVEILARHKALKGVIVYLPTHDWGFMFQRPQQLARHFARAGYLYFYCTRNEQSDAIVGFQQAEPNLFLCSVPPETFACLQQPIFLIGSPWYAPMLEWFNKPLVIYDHYDDLKVSAARLQDHAALLQEANIVLTTSQALQEAVLSSRPDALLVPNAVDYDFVRATRLQSSVVPADLSEIIQMDAPIIGYSGALAAWFDYELVRQIANLRPGWQFVLLGVDYDGSLGESDLLHCPNVHYLGLKSYQDLFLYVWHFSVAIIPFVLNEITRATSPVKLFEYFACHKPVISTPLPECLKYPVVLTANDPEAFAKQIEQALLRRDDDQFLRCLDGLARANTWAARVAQIEQAIFGVSAPEKLQSATRTLQNEQA